MVKKKRQCLKCDWLIWFEGKPKITCAPNDGVKQYFNKQPLYCKYFKEREEEK